LATKKSLELDDIVSTYSLDVSSELDALKNDCIFIIPVTATQMTLNYENFKYLKLN